MVVYKIYTAHPDRVGPFDGLTTAHSRVLNAITAVKGIQLTPCSLPTNLAYLPATCITHVLSTTGIQSSPLAGSQSSAPRFKR
jgi:hypothetical protein